MAGNEMEREWEQDMISHVKGPLMGIEEGVVVVEVSSLGLATHVPISLLPKLPGLGQEMTVYTYFQVREDAMTLYGFLHPQDRGMFRQLLGASGIEPKDILGILSVLRLDDLRFIIVGEDVKTLAEAPGVGTETAQKVILNLRGKISVNDVLGSMASGTDLGAGSDAAAMAGLVEAVREAVQILVTLGYTNSRASGAVKQVEIVDRMTFEDVLKALLRYLSFL